jgi:hypothetical protein
MPASTRAPTPAPACRPGVLYCEDFEDGLPQGWELDPGWKVTQEGGNRFMRGADHYWATLLDQSWEDYRVRLRLNLRQGAIHLVYRLKEGSTRYFIGFEEAGLYLSKQTRGSFSDLTAVVARHALDRWYKGEIAGWGGHLQVLVDGRVELDYTDPDPLRNGTIAFETLDYSSAQVDDIEVLPPGSPAPVPPIAIGTRGPTPDRLVIAQQTQLAQVRATQTAIARSQPQRQPCSADPAPIFAGVWDRNRMGCPTAGEFSATTAYEPFERGWMLWRKDNDGIYAFFDGGGYDHYSLPPTDILFWCADAQDLGNPRRGFGKVWCENPDVRKQIGNASGGEIGDSRPLQEFENGFMVYVPERRAVVNVYNNGQWANAP